MPIPKKSSRRSIAKVSSPTWRCLKVSILLHLNSWDTDPSIDQLKRSQPNLGALKEYRKREAEFLDRAQDLEKVTSARDAHKKKYDELRKARLDEFMAGFNIISTKLKEMYQVCLPLLSDAFLSDSARR